jgi:drug/metabolite transporter (DMT)-like permease
VKADVTGVGIALGLAGAAIYSVIAARRHKRFKTSATVTVFLGVFALPVGVVLINAALQGDSTQLPSSWREYVTIAGVVGIGIAAEGTWRAFRDAAARPGTLSESDDSPEDRT